MDIAEQIELLKRGTSGIIPENGLAEKLQKSAKTGKPLVVKLGLDPTAPDIHLGFAVVLRKLRRFQDLGHQVVIIIGDYTALIGDPSGRSATRPMLSEEQIRANAETYVDQLSAILDRSRTTVRFNGEWLGRLSFADVVRLTSKMTVAQVLEREDFAKRFAEHQPISLHELLYPLAQAYDSVAIEADIEMGGQDQMFNILAGRDLQREVGQDPQIALFMPLLVGLDGEKKMSKSLGNYIGIAEPPNDMFGKIMSIPDRLLGMYFELCTDVPLAEVKQLLHEAETGAVNPKDVKRRLGREITALYHGAEAAQAADAEFERVHAKKEIPSEIPEIEVTLEGDTGLLTLLVLMGLAASTSEARRLVQQGGVKIDGSKAADVRETRKPEAWDGIMIQVGARRFARVRTKP
jgi:tyrosyl-tRNA synthetase